MEATFLKHPLYWKPSSPAMIVPSKDHGAQLLIQVFHQKLARDGRDRTLAQLREQFWTPKGRSAVHKVVRSCLTRKKQRVVRMELMMAKFPSFRTTAYEPCFTYTMESRFLEPSVSRTSRYFEPNFNCFHWICFTHLQDL